MTTNAANGRLRRPHTESTSFFTASGYLGRQFITTATSHSDCKRGRGKGRPRTSAKPNSFTNMPCECPGGVQGTLNTSTRGRGPPRPQQLSASPPQTLDNMDADAVTTLHTRKAVPQQRDPSRRPGSMHTQIHATAAAVAILLAIMSAATIVAAQPAAMPPPQQPPGSGAGSPPAPAAGGLPRLTGGAGGSFGGSGGQTPSTVLAQCPSEALLLSDEPPAASGAGGGGGGGGGGDGGGGLCTCTPGERLCAAAHPGWNASVVHALAVSTRPLLSIVGSFRTRNPFHAYIRDLRHVSAYTVRQFACQNTCPQPLTISCPAPKTKPPIKPTAQGTTHWSTSIHRRITHSYHSPLPTAFFA